MTQTGIDQTPDRLPSNEEVAHVLERVAELLGAQNADRYRVAAYRDAATRVRNADTLISEIAVTEPLASMERLPGIGVSIGSAIREYAASGRLGILERLEGQVSPEDLFASVPGIGEELARRIHAELGLDTLEELELAAHDGQLERVPGFGPRRTEAVRDILAGLLRWSGRRRARLVNVRRERRDRPSVKTLLEVDAEYRSKAEAGELRTLTPRRFNPERRSWLPILHTERDGWTFTALFSNTARAHDLGTTDDWVILYYERDGDEGQSTVVTERRGAMVGRRVVRGHEAECLEHYRL